METILTCGDDGFGPQTKCRGGLDFTLFFEDCFFSIVPSCLLILSLLLRGKSLWNSRTQKVGRSPLYWAKLVRSTWQRFTLSLRALDPCSSIRSVSTFAADCMGTSPCAANASITGSYGFDLVCLPWSLVFVSLRAFIFYSSILSAEFILVINTSVRHRARTDVMAGILHRPRGYLYS